MKRNLTAKQKSFLGIQRQKTFQASPQQLEKMLEEELEKKDGEFGEEEDDCDWNTD